MHKLLFTKQRAQHKTKALVRAHIRVLSNKIMYLSVLLLVTEGRTMFLTIEVIKMLQIILVFLFLFGVVLSDLEEVRRRQFLHKPIMVFML